MRNHDSICDVPQFCCRLRPSSVTIATDSHNISSRSYFQISALAPYSISAEGAYIYPHFVACIANTIELG